MPYRRLGETFRGLGRHLGAPRGGAAAFVPSDVASVDIWVRSDEGTWQDAGKSTPADDDGETVYTWANKIAGGNDGLQATAARRPTLKVIAGAHYVRFSGADICMNFSVGVDASQTYFILAKTLNAPDALTRRMIGIGSTDVVNSNASFYYKNNNPTFAYLSNQAAGKEVISGTTTNLNVISIVFANASSCSMRINGGTAVTFDPNDAYQAVGNNMLVVGSAGGNADFDVMEIIHASDGLADADRENIENYLLERAANPT